MNTMYIYTQKEIEDHIGCDFFKLYYSLFESSQPTVSVNIVSNISNNMLLVMIGNTFTLLEEESIKRNDISRLMFKDARSRLLSSNKIELIEIIHHNTGVGVSSIHHDISTVTGEEAFVFSLKDKPHCKSAKGLSHLIQYLENNRASRASL